jgi:putative hydrolase of the HAD superfamily
MTGQELLIFDLDDTLLDTSDLYWRARSAFVEKVSKEGFDRQIVVDEFEKTDTKNMQKWGFSPHRYGKSMTETYQLLCSRFESKSKQETLNFIDEFCSRIVVDTVPEIVEGAIELLEWAYRKFHLVVLTRGEEKLQHRKLKESKLIDYFKEVYVVPYKNIQVFEFVLTETGFKPEETWVIGDSIKSDINPGLLVGAKCILYSYKHHSYSWLQEHDSEPVGNFYKVNLLIEIKSVLETLNGNKVKSANLC